MHVNSLYNHFLVFNIQVIFNFFLLQFNEHSCTYIFISDYLFRTAFIQSFLKALTIIYRSPLEKNDPLPSLYAFYFVRVWDTPWWKLQNMAKICHICPDAKIQRFRVHNLWNWHMPRTGLSSLLSLSLYPPHTHTRTHTGTDISRSTSSCKLIS